MANDLLIQPDTEPLAAAPLADDCELDVTFGTPVEEKPIWTGLYESIRDVFFSPKLPPLELTSTPIPVPDRMAVKRNPWAVGISFTVNAGILAVLIFLGVKSVIDKAKMPPVVTPIDVTVFKAPKAAVVAGGGGGSPDKVEVSKGRIPPRMPEMDTAPKVVQPPLPSIDVQTNIAIPDNPALPNFGMSDSTNVKLASGGNGSGMGLGNGHGNGIGNGSGGNIGGGVYRVGGGVTAPTILRSVQAEFSDEARRNKYQGLCVIEIIVDEHGNPHNPHIVQALGEGLDENAVKAIMQYKFRPGMKDGKPVAVGPVDIEINFRLF